MKQDVIELDGAIGGGQVLRTALSLAMVTGRALHIHNIRARRSRPGLMRQHLTAVLAAAEVCGAKVSGAELNSQSLHFEPGTIRGGDYQFSIGTAGSCSLVLQTLLPALLHAPEPSRVTISGGTHNPLAPPADFLERTWLPLLRRMGARVELNLLRHGFVPAGGGELEAFVQPSTWSTLHLPERGALLSASATVLIAGVAEHVAERELRRVGQRLDILQQSLHTAVLDPACGPGNVLLLDLAFEQVTEVFSAIGRTNLRAEAVADLAVNEARTWLQGKAAVAEYLADQLLLPMALAGAGSFTAACVSEHMQSSISVIERFLPVRIECREQERGLVNVVCRSV